MTKVKNLQIWILNNQSFQDVSFSCIEICNMINLFGRIQTSKTGGHSYSDTSPHEVNEYYLSRPSLGQNYAQLTGFLLKMGQPRPLFHLFLVFSNNSIFATNQQIMWKNIMPIQYKVPWFEPTTSLNESSPITTRPGHPPLIWLLVNR